MIGLHYLAMQGIANYPHAEAAQIVANDRESARRDLFDHIECGDFPKWRICVQVISGHDAATYAISPFDLTKVWPHKGYPLIDVGMIELNRNPENYFADVEHLAAARLGMTL